MKYLTIPPKAYSFRYFAQAELIKKPTAQANSHSCGDYVEIQRGQRHSHI